MKHKYSRTFGGYATHVDGIGTVVVKRNLPAQNIGWDARATLSGVQVVGFNNRDQAVDALLAAVNKN